MIILRIQRKEMRKMINAWKWHILEIRRKRLIPDAYFDERKRIKLCRIDEKLIKLKERGLFNGGKKNV